MAIQRERAKQSNGRFRSLAVDCPGRLALDMAIQREQARNWPGCQRGTLDMAIQRERARNWPGCQRGKLDIAIQRERAREKAGRQGLKQSQSEIYMP